MPGDSVQETWFKGCSLAHRGFSRPSHLGSPSQVGGPYQAAPDADRQGIKKCQLSQVVSLAREYLVAVLSIGGLCMGAGTTPKRVNLSADQQPVTAIQVNWIFFSFKKAANA
jgi:hypothetical protein